MKRLSLPFILLGLYLLIIGPFTGYLKAKPFEEKLGYVPDARVLKWICGDQKILAAQLLVMKTLFYYGSLFEQQEGKLKSPPDYFTLYKNIETSVKIDPYNMDAYYFAQATLVWEVGKIREANALLEHGMKYRTWDYYLPFFAGFNYAYFLHDYAKAAFYYQRAGELSGDPLFMNLAGRYLHQSGQTGLAIVYLASMEKGARNEAVRKTLHVRLQALLGVKLIEDAIIRYHGRFKTNPGSIEQLLIAGYLEKVPLDPYGGKFYIDEQGQVSTTSKFAFSPGTTRPNPER